MQINLIYHTRRKFFGHIGEWIEQKGFDLETHSLKIGDSLPKSEDIEMLFVLGGSQNVNDFEKYPWIEPEIKLIKELIKRKIPIFGICLGAQIIARAFDFTVEKNTEPEMGWFDVTLNENGIASPFFKNVPKTFTPLHLHNDIIRLPKSIKPLATSEITNVQAFNIDNALALQFHPEHNEDTLNLMLERRNSIVAIGNYCQSSNKIKDGFGNIGNNRRILFQILDNYYNLVSGD